MSDVTEPTHVLVGRIRRELDDNLGYLVASIANGEYMQAQSYTDRIYVLLGVIETLLDDEDAVIYS